MVEIEQWFALMEDFEAPKNSKGKALKKSKWSSEQIQRSEVNDKVTKLLVNLLPSHILGKMGEFKDAKELWSKLASIHEIPSRPRRIQRGCLIGSK